MPMYRCELRKKRLETRTKVYASDETFSREYADAAVVRGIGRSIGTTSWARRWMTSEDAVLVVRRKAS